METAYKQECRTVQDVECRLVSLEHKGEHLTRKLCEPAPREKCVPVPFKVSGN